MVRLLKLLALCALFFAGTALGFYFMLRSFSSGSATYVPAIEGFPAEEAKFMTEREHLLFEIKDEKYDTRRETGVVIMQAPAAGMAVKKGQTVYVTVSKGIERAIAPNLAGMSLDSAQIAIQQSGMNFKGVSYVSSSSPSQTVLSQSPARGAVISRDADCWLLVSQGGRRPVFLMPEVGGRNVKECETVFSEYGIAANIEIRGGEESETVREQRPLPGYPISASETIGLGVSR
ncbi:MAG TPA: PASTA domain-containing protein [Acidobacteriota bacterium]|nr:PASTA domain-containing protein [Acidobacteriota bacterium]HQO18847.1 PASTA domain-containing protein [Acidobacteriota bacterium]HQQ47232.1 PASTA domain-containing protein [Acidobacteriota bacterium]